MLLDIRTKTNTRNRFKPGRLLVLQCDACNTQFERPFGRLKDQQTHACSRKCHGLLERKGAIRDELKRQTSLERYGVDHPRKSAEVEEQRRSTCLERYGVEYTLQLKDVRERIRQTCLERYGVENPFQADEIKTKITNTLLKNHGVEHALQSSELRAKYRSTCLNRFGVESPMQSEEIRSKIDWHASWQKQHATKKANGSYKKSSAEEQFGERLSAFGHVERQVIVEHDDGAWSIDFKVNGVYVQFNGVYWHGLDRPIEVIRQSTSKRDVQIARKYDDDRRQDAWFATRGLRLLRITDLQAKTMTMECLAASLR